MVFIYESELNVRLASFLSEKFGIDCRAERSVSRKRPDIRCYYSGVSISIEASYNASDAVKDAFDRAREGLADLVLAVHYVKKLPDVPEEELVSILKGKTLRVKVVDPREPEKALEEGGWLEDAGVDTLADIIKNAVSHIVSEADVRSEVERVRQIVDEFVKVMTSIDPSLALRESISSILYRLYGFSVAEARDAEIVFGQAALALLLSAVFYERVRHQHKLQPIDHYMKQYGAIAGFRRAIEDLLNIDYEPAVKLAMEILNSISPRAEAVIRKIVETAQNTARKPHLLSRDFAGRVYHEITGDIAVRKGFATFYTEIPAAYLLANLALRVVLEVERELETLEKNEVKRIINVIPNLKIADFACGSGTLLTASLYSAVKIARTLCFTADVECPKVEKKLIEEGIYGLDALRYAAQITAINLALISSTPISRENVSAIYLGYIPGKGAWLGSLELLNDGRRVGGLLYWIDRGLEGVAEKVSVTNSEGGKVEILNKYDIVIMNPPFTRPTGRVSKEFEEGRGGFFGFIAEKTARDDVLKKYEDVRERVRRDLIEISKNFFSREEVLKMFLEPLSDQQKAKEHGLDQYYSIGQAGEGLLFLYLAYKHIKPGGVVAFVLPRNLLSGVSWFLARSMLADRFHLKYVVVSSDAERGYNFSESTSLSECLIVAKRVDEHDPDEKTVFVNLLKKPRSALEALLLAEKAVVERGRGFTELSSGARCYIREVGRVDLLKNLDNLNRFVSLPDLEVVDLGLKILEEGDLSVEGVRIPTIRLGEISDSIELSSPVFHECFKPTSTKTPYPLVYRGSEVVRSRMTVEPNAFAVLKCSKARELFEKWCGRVLIPDRIWLDTAHVVALYSSTPVISNVFYVVRLKEKLDRVRLAEAEKALVYWLNTTWGLLSVLMNREETRGRWMRLTRTQWRLQPVLNVFEVDSSTLSELAAVFDKLSKQTPRRLPKQYSGRESEVDSVRLEIDLEFLKCFNSGIDESRARSRLLDIYKRVSIAFERWIG